eukprot:2982578-Pleurochrysis_carterae.AAC.1
MATAQEVACVQLRTVWPLERLRDRYAYPRPRLLARSSACVRARMGKKARLARLALNLASSEPPPPPPSACNPQKPKRLSATALHSEKVAADGE